MSALRARSGEPSNQLGEGQVIAAAGARDRDPHRGKPARRAGRGRTGRVPAPCGRWPRRAGPSPTGSATARGAPRGAGRCHRRFRAASSRRSPASSAAAYSPARVVDVPETPEHRKRRWRPSPSRSTSVAARAGTRPPPPAIAAPFTAIRAGPRAMRMSSASRRVAVVSGSCSQRSPAPARRTRSPPDWPSGRRPSPPPGGDSATALSSALASHRVVRQHLDLLGEAVQRTAARSPSRCAAWSARRRSWITLP